MEPGNEVGTKRVKARVSQTIVDYYFDPDWFKRVADWLDILPWLEPLIGKMLHRFTNLSLIEVVNMQSDETPNVFKSGRRIIRNFNHPSKICSHKKEETIWTYHCLKFSCG